MADLILLAWTVDVAGTPLSAAEAATKLGAVKLYEDAQTDPVLGQLLGLTVEDDETVVAGSTATRTLTLNMTTDIASIPAPPPFPCHPDKPTPPKLPYKLRKSITLNGSFWVVNGSAVVETSLSQRANIAAGVIVQFLSQPGIDYVIAVVTETTITLTAPYTGKTANTGAFRLVPAPAKIVAAYSTSPLDTGGVPETVPPIPPGQGAQEIELSYLDSTGAGPFGAEVTLTGKRPAVFELEVGSIDVAEILEFFVDDTGAFDNSVGQITLVELSEELPSLPVEPTRAEYLGKITDEGQLLIDRHLVYLPPSYFALAQQGASFPQLEGDFLVTTGSTRVETTVDQTGVLDTGYIIQFASQLNLESPLQTRPVYYTVKEVGPTAITLEKPYTGFETNATDEQGSQPVDTNIGTKGNIGSVTQKHRTGAFLVEPTLAAPPNDAQLAGPLAQFVDPQTAGPPAAPPLTPVTIPTPTFLSDLFTQTLQLALVVPVVPEEIVIV